MALNGAFFTNVGSHWRVTGVWSGVQNVAGNYTDITLYTVWQSLDSYGTVNSSGTKNGSSTIDGTTENFTFNASLSGQQDKTVHTQTKRVYHNSDGTKQISMSVFLTLGLTLGGTYYGTVTANSGTITLDPIVQSSTLTSSPSWTAGNSLPIAISRPNTNFTHEIGVVVNGSQVWYGNNITTGLTINFTDEQMEFLFHVMNGSNGNVEIILNTFNNGVFLNSKSYYGTVYLPSKAYVNPLSPFTLGDTVELSVTRPKDIFTCKIEIYFDNNVYLTEIANVYSYWEWTPTTQQIQAIYQALPSTATQTTFRFRCYTYFKGTRVHSSYEDTTVTAYIAQGAPIFYPSYVRYADTNSVTTAITGDNQYLIGGKSHLTVYIDFEAVGQNGATISKYIIQVDGQEIIVTTIGTYFFGTISNGSYRELVVRAVDSRGLETRVTIPLKMVTYSIPTLIPYGERIGDYGETAEIQASGSYSPLTINGVAKNAIQSVSYRYKATTSSTWGSWNTLTFSGSNGAFLSAQKSLTLDNSTSYNVEFRVIDKLSTVFANIVIGAGVPLVFIDSDLGSVGVGRYPTKAKSVEADNVVAGTLEADSFEVDELDTNTVTIGKDGNFPATVSQEYDTTTITTSKGNFGVQIASSYVDIETNRPRIYMTVPITMEQATTFSSNVYFSTAPTMSGTEVGYCGTGAIMPTTGTSICSGVGVNFRIRKSYVPSSISFTTISSNDYYGTPEVRDITVDGFWMFIRGNNLANTFFYWRGYYEA